MYSWKKTVTIFHDNPYNPSCFHVTLISSARPPTYFLVAVIFHIFKTHLNWEAHNFCVIFKLCNPLKRQKMITSSRYFVYWAARTRYTIQTDPNSYLKTEYWADESEFGQLLENVLEATGQTHASNGMLVRSCEKKNPLVLLWTTDKLFPVFCLCQNVLFPLPHTKIQVSNDFSVDLNRGIAIKRKHALFCESSFRNLFLKWYQLNQYHPQKPLQVDVMVWQLRISSVLPLILLCSAPPYSCSCQVCRPFFLFITKQGRRPKCSTFLLDVRKFWDLLHRCYAQIQ